MKNLLTTLTVLLVAATTVAQVPSYVPTNGLVGWWPFNGNANDESGNGNNGTVNGATLTSDRFGNSNAAYSFDGVNDNIIIPHSSSFNYTNSLTISLWFKANTLGQQAILLEKFSSVGGQPGTGGPQIAIRPDNTIDLNLLNNNISNIVYSSQNYNDLQWMHIVGVWDGNTLTFYNNLSPGTSISFQGPISVSTNNLSVGFRTINDRFFNGKIDDIAIYNRALTQQEITAIYSSQTCSASITPAGPTNLCSGQSLTLTASGSSGLQSCTSSGLPSNLQNGLVGYWPFCGNANDGSGNGNNGTVNSATLTTDRFGNSNAAYSFNGVNSLIQVAHSNSLNFGTNSFTISAWVFSNTNNTTGTTRLIVSKERTTAPDGFQLRLEQLNNGGGGGCVNGTFYSATSLLNFNCGTLSCFNNLPNITLGQWKLLTLVRNGNTHELYQNGVLLGVQSFSCALDYSNNLNNLIFGAENNASNTGFLQFFDGKIDDIAIYNRALSTAEIQQLYGLGSTQYLWSTGATTPSISVSPTQTTTYTVTVTENGQTCTASSTVNVSTPTATISANGPTSFCTGGSVTLTANSGSSYLWSNGATSQSITVTQGGNYSVTVTNNGCSATSGVTTVTVNPTPTAGVTVGGATTFCTGGSVTLTAQGTGSYLWSNGATSQSITATQGGNYSVTVTNNGCSATSGVTTVTVNPTPTASIAPQGNTTFCQGGFVVLQAAGGGTYQWNTGAQTANISVSQSGTYVVQVSQNGCTASAQQQVTVNPLPSVSLQPIAALCANASAVALTGGSPAGGSFTVNGTPATTLNPAQTGSGQQTVAYTFTNGNGCSNTATQSATVNATPAVSMSGLNTNYTLTDPFSTLTGTPTGGVFNGAGMVANYFDPSVAGLGTHGIAYIYVDGNGCIGSDAQCTTVDLNVNIGGSNIGVDEGSIDVYPNPSNGNFAVAIEGIEGIIGLSVFDARGREVLVTSLVGNGQKTIQNIDLSNYANGVYTLSIRTAKGTASQKLVKE